MPLAPDVPYEIGDAAFGGYVAGIIDTTQGNIIPADASQTGLRYVLIVSPSSMYAFGILYKTTDTAAPPAARTRWDGLTATQAMAADAEEYPAADYCAGLAYPSDGGSPWYLPAMDELEVVYRNLKGTTEANVTATWTSGAGSFPYNGAVVNRGYNPSSDPPGPAYTTTVPGQTSVALFQDGGGQDLGNAGSNIYYMTATEYAESTAWTEGFSGTVAGSQGWANKTNTSRNIRPVRRVLLNTAPDAPTLLPINWETIAPMPGGGRRYVAGATDNNGRIYVIGEEGGRNERFDPSSGLWETLTPSPYGYRSGISAATDNDGYIYAIGGEDLDAVVFDIVERYDPGTDTWTTVAPLPSPRAYHATAVDQEGRIYVIGGVDVYWDLTDTVYRYDPAANTWTTLAPMPTARAYVSGATDHSGYIYAIGGDDITWTAVSTVERYDPDTNTWTSVAEISTARDEIGTATDNNGDIYAIGGYHYSSDTGVGTYFTLVEKYTPVTDTWITVEPLSTRRSGMAVAVDNDGRIYAIGGDNNDDGMFLSSVERFSFTDPAVPQTFQWQHNDPDGDPQNAYNFAYQLVGAATWIETGWITSGTSSHTVPANTLTAGTKYKRRVQTRDPSGAESPWSDEVIVQVNTVPDDPYATYAIGDAAFGGYVAGLIDTTQGNIIASDASQTGLRYLLIVAPASLDAARQWKTSNSAAPAAARTRWDGLSATQAMNSAEYPTAQYCASLSYPSDGGSPWYLPAMDELEVVYRNLKGTTEANNVYVNTGHEFPGGGHPVGYNPSSDPAGAQYTATVPSQTSVPAFRDGGGQDLGNAGYNFWYWSATEYSAVSYVWTQRFSGSGSGNQGYSTKTDSSGLVRPVRRVRLSSLAIMQDDVWISVSREILQNGAWIPVSTDKL